jgi:hypothetical protein
MDVKTTEGIRHVWRKCWLQSIYDFTSLKNQEELWLAKRPGEMQTYVECMCGYFDDSCHGQSLEELCAGGFLSKPEVDACREFHRLADDYNPPSGGDNSDDRMILADPKWHAVVLSAKEAWRQLRLLITSEEEQAIMNNCDDK